MVIRETGMSLAEILDLTTLDFNRLYMTTVRLSYSDQIQKAWSRMISAQGDHKNMEEFLRPMSEFLNPGSAANGGVDDFFRTFSGGI